MRLGKLLCAAAVMALLGVVFCGCALANDKITTFDELKTAAEKSYIGKTTIDAVAPITITEDITIPARLTVSVEDSLIVPEGITVTLIGSIDIEKGAAFELNGIVRGNGIIKLHGTAKVTSRGNIFNDRGIPVTASGQLTVKANTQRPSSKELTSGSYRGQEQSGSYVFVNYTDHILKNEDLMYALNSDAVTDIYIYQQGNLTGYPGYPPIEVTRDAEIRRGKTVFVNMFGNFSVKQGVTLTINGVLDLNDGLMTVKGDLAGVGSLYLNSSGLSKVIQVPLGTLRDRGLSILTTDMMPIANRDDDVNSLRPTAGIYAGDGEGHFTKGSIAANKISSLDIEIDNPNVSVRADASVSTSAVSGLPENYESIGSILLRLRVGKGAENDDVKISMPVPLSFALDGGEDNVSVLIKPKSGGKYSVFNVNVPWSNTIEFTINSIGEYFGSDKTVYICIPKTVNNTPGNGGGNTGGGGNSSGKDSESGGGCSSGLGVLAFTALAVFAMRRKG